MILVTNIVVGNRENGPVIEQREHHDHHRRQGIEVEDEDGRRHEQQHAQRLRNPVDRVTVHPLENPAALLDRINDDR